MEGKKNRVNRIEKKESKNPGQTGQTGQDFVSFTPFYPNSEIDRHICIDAGNTKEHGSLKNLELTKTPIMKLFLPVILTKQRKNKIHIFSNYCKSVIWKT